MSVCTVHLKAEPSNVPNFLVLARKLRTDDLKPIATRKLDLFGFRELLFGRVSYFIYYGFRRPTIVVIYFRTLRSLIR